MDYKFPVLPPASDGIPRLNLGLLHKTHIEARRAALVQLESRLHISSKSGWGDSVSAHASWLIHQAYQDLPMIEGAGIVITRDVLVCALHDLAHSVPLGGSTHRLVQKFRQKYEVFKRLAAQYSPADVRKYGDEWASQEILGLLAFVLLSQFQLGNDYRNLNAALKINDGLDAASSASSWACWAALMNEVEVLEQEFTLS